MIPAFKFIAAAGAVIALLLLYGWITAPGNPCAEISSTPMGNSIKPGPKGYSLGWDGMCKSGMRWVGK